MGVYIYIRLVVGFEAHTFAFVEEAADYIGGIVKSRLWGPFDFFFWGSRGRTSLFV